MCRRCVALEIMSTAEADQIDAAEREGDLATVLSESVRIARRLRAAGRSPRDMAQHEERQGDEDVC
jgi:hypothetical protein